MEHSGPTNLLKLASLILALSISSSLAASQWSILQPQSEGKSGVNADTVDGMDAADLGGLQNLSEVMEQGNSVGSFNLDMNNNDIDNIGGIQSCGPDQFINGNGNCVEDSFAPDTDNQNLQEVLAQGNSAGSYAINISGNSIVDAETIIGEDGGTALRTTGSGSSYWVVQDASNSNQAITRFNEGGNVGIPNGNLDVGSGSDTNVLTARSSVSSPNYNDNTLELADDNRPTVSFHRPGTDSGEIYFNGEFQMNDNLDMNGNDVQKVNRIETYRVQTGRGNSDGNGIEISDDGGFYDDNDGWITFDDRAGGGDSSGLSIEQGNVRLNNGNSLQNGDSSGSLEVNSGTLDMHGWSSVRSYTDLDMTGNNIEDVNQFDSRNGYGIRKLDNEQTNSNDDPRYWGLLRLEDGTNVHSSGRITSERSSFSRGISLEFHAESGWDGDNSPNPADSELLVQAYGTGSNYFTRLVEFDHNGNTWIGIERDPGGCCSNYEIVFSGQSQRAGDQTDTFPKILGPDEVSSVSDYPGNSRSPGFQKFGGNIDMNNNALENVGRIDDGSGNTIAEIDNTNRDFQINDNTGFKLPVGADAH